MAVTFAPEKLSSNTYIVAGTVVLDGTNPTDVVTNFSTIVAAFVQEQTAVAPALTASVFTSSVSGGTLSIQAWEPTGAGDTTLVASSDAGTVNYFIIGY